jgi:hypothetical protein
MILAFIYVFLRIFRFINFAHIFGALGGLIIGLLIRRREMKQYVNDRSFAPSRPSSRQKKSSGIDHKTVGWLRSLRWNIALRWAALKDRIFFRREKRRAKKIMSQSASKDKMEKSPLIYNQSEYEIALLKQFRDLVDNNPQISLSHLANALMVTEDELYHKLMIWRQKLPFHLQGEKIIIDDFSQFLTKIDSIIQKWENYYTS